MAASKKRTKTKRARSSGKRSLTNARLLTLVGEATIDSNGRSEQATGLFTMIENHLALPFTTEVLGAEVSVVRVDLTERDDIVAICEQRKEQQAIAILDLPLPSPRPKGWEWIEAYRHWATSWG
jgi:hypothetical protein